MTKSRRFETTYHVAVPEFPKSARRVEVWVPFPRSTRHQEVHAIEVRTSLPYSVCFDAVYGNAVLHAVADALTMSGFDLAVTTHATRFEWSASLDEQSQKPLPALYSHLAPQLQENRLIRFTSEIVGIAQNIKEGRMYPIDIAIAAYDYVLEHMKYDKSGDGWGSGDAEFACSVGKGNCTDFHSLFLAIIRACGVPGQFEIGIAFPSGMQEGDITQYKCGYHCWTSFYANGIGWIPVDCSEAAQKPELRDYYFGAIDADRFLLSYGRDIEFPGRTGHEAINFFTEPVVETQDGVPVYYEKRLGFRNL